MAENKHWLGKALQTTEEKTITVATGWATSDVATLTIGNLDLVITIGSLTNAADVANAIDAAINAVDRSDSLVLDETLNVGGQEIIELQELTSSVSGDVVTIMHNTAGVPFEIEVSFTVAGAGTLTLATTVAATGIHWINNPDNWSDESLPVSNDTMVFGKNSVSALYGLEHFRSGINKPNAAGTTDGTTTSKLVDSTQDDFIAEVQIGDTVFNITDSTEAIVTAIDSNSILSLNADIMVSGDTYTIGTGTQVHITITTDYQGAIGLPVENPAGYREYRKRYLQLYGTVTCRWEEGDSDAAFGGPYWIDGEGHNLTITCLDSGPVSPTDPTINLSGGTLTLSLIKGSIFVEPINSPSLVPANIVTFISGAGDNEDSEALFIIGPDVTWTSGVANIYSGTVIYKAITDKGGAEHSVFVFGGTVFMEGDGNEFSMVVHDQGTLVIKGTGAYAAIQIIGGTVDCNLDSRSKSIGGLTLQPGSTFKDFSNVVSVPEVSIIGTLDQMTIEGNLGL